MKKWYCLNKDGQLYIIGEYANYDEADIQANLMGLDPIWIIDQETAIEWRNAMA